MYLVFLLIGVALMVASYLLFGHDIHYWLMNMAMSQMGETKYQYFDKTAALSGSAVGIVGFFCVMLFVRGVANRVRRAGVYLESKLDKL